MTKFALITLSISVALAAVDFTNRLKVDVASKGYQPEQNDSPAISVRFLTKEDIEALESLLNIFDVPPPAPPPKTQKTPPKSPPKPNIMPREQQEQQQGRLDALFDGVHKYTLRGTFNNKGERFAVLEKQNLETSDLEKLIVKQGQDVSGYSTTRIEGNVLSLSKGKRTVDLYLFLKKSSS